MKKPLHAYIILETPLKWKEFPEKVTIREIYALQMKLSVWKGCKVFDVYGMDDKYNGNKLKIEDIPILKDFKDIFLEEVPGLPSKKRHRLYNRSYTWRGTNIKIPLLN